MEAFSSRGEIQSCLATLRNREVHGIDPFGGMFGDEDPVGEEQDPASADGHHTPTTGAAGATVHNDLGFEMEEEEEDEEDYMVHLQRQEEDEAEPALCQTNTPAQLTEDVRKRIQVSERALVGTSERDRASERSIESADGGFFMVAAIRGGTRCAPRT